MSYAKKWLRTDARRTLFMRAHVHTSECPDPCPSVYLFCARCEHGKETRWLLKLDGELSSLCNNAVDRHLEDCSECMGAKS